MTWDWPQVSKTIGEYSTHLTNESVSVQILMGSIFQDFMRVTS